MNHSDCFANFSSIPNKTINLPQIVDAGFTFLWFQLVFLFFGVTDATLWLLQISNNHAIPIKVFDTETIELTLEYN